MKLKNIIPFALVALVLSLNSCYDEKMEWGDPYTHPKDENLPLELQEKISRYAALNTYTTSKLGVGIDFNLYLTDETYRNLINQNFDEITPGNEMKQSSVMNSQGVLDFTNLDNILPLLETAGLTVYGHTLVWHNQQKASYINSLIQPTYIPGPAGENLVENGSFEESTVGATINGSGTKPMANAWGSQMGSVEIIEDAAMAVEGSKLLKAVNGDGTTYYNFQIQSQDISVVPGHNYEISFFIRSEGADDGLVTITFGSSNQMGNQYPYVNDHTGGTGGKYATNGTWKQVTWSPETVNGDGAMTVKDGVMTIQFLINLGSVANITYYIDNVVVLDLDAEPALINMLSNGDFENGTLDPWNGWGNGTRALSAEGEGYSSKYAMILSNPQNGQAYESQAAYTFDNPLVNGTKYKATAMVKCSVADGSIQMEVQNASYGGQYSGGKTVGTSWQEISWEFTASTDDRIRFLFDFGAVAGDYYIDNVVFVEVTETPAAAPELRASGPIEIHQTPEEKAHKVDSVLQAWIKGMTEYFRGKVVAWDVVNEPMNENGTLREGVEDLKSTSTFYWQYYLGKDYAVKAFKYAVEGDPNAKLFINDYGLESASGAKLDGLLEYVQYIESQGARIDGIGTQMHLNINWTDTAAIKTMFQKLAATGKLIKISELDIAVANASNPESPVSPTTEQYALQAELYRFVAAMYNQYIPEAQRYGITVWGVSDNEKEHEYWLTNDEPCLWNKDYARKHAYKGLADGLAGKDVSIDFPGTLVY